MKLPKTYEPSQYEPAIYALWETSGAFAPTGQGKPYSIIMPPPNANGNLHVGHGYMIPLQDILIRYHRMRGYDTVWIPGADHAGFETWVVFERSLEKQGKTRFDFSREELYKMTWDFVEKQRGNMELQLRALGASCDWSSLVFTLDKKVIDTVFQTFKLLWDDGLVYRGERIVNYCTFHHTSFADIEIVFKDDSSCLWHISYPLSSGEGEITIATTRPETLLGDVAIAVNPNDNRYINLIGKTVKLPLTNREIPIIADEAVDIDFGTGAVKITPAHDPLDFEIGQRHELNSISIIGQDGLITDNAPKKYRGLTATDAREAVIKDLETAGRLTRTEKYSHQVPHCYRCDTVIQPLLMKQWFISTRVLAQKAKMAIQDGQIKFTPSQKANEIIHYLDELKDWNISRQIPWGIPIPAFHNIDDPDDWIFDDRVEETEITVNGKTYIRDNDTFDTWFSSGQWPFITTDYLSDGELSRFYPNSVMETGADILRPWVSRMIMLGLYRTGKVPFKDVFLHGLILDEHGQKMSKSKGNVINPMEVIEEFGSDALRIGIIMNRSAGQSQAFSPATVVAGRNFCNKLWNIARFIEGKGDDITRSQIDNSQPETIAENWIFRKLDNARIQIENHLSNYRFAEAADTIYHTVWDDLADWFIEASKQNARPEFLRNVLNITLRLAHPFAPFVTETIWTTLRNDNTTLIAQNWPDVLQYNKDSADSFDAIIDLVSEIRHILSDLPNGKYGILYQNDEFIAENTDLIKQLANLSSIDHTDQPRGLKVPSTANEVWLDISDDMIYEHQARLELKLVDIRKQIKNLETRLDNKSYVSNAPENLVNESRSQLAESKLLESKIAAELTDASN